MFAAQVARHLASTGWTLDDDPTGWAADFLIERRGARKAVLVREEPPGPYEIARFGAECRRRGLKGLLVCPDDATVSDLCDPAGLDFLAGERFLEAPPPPPVPPMVVRPAGEPFDGELQARVPVQGAHTSWWRWAVVAAIWAAAITLSVYDVWRLAS